MIPKLQDSALFKAITFAHEQPELGLPRLARMIAVATREGRLEEAHVLSDTLVHVACKADRYLGTAEKLARKLVAQQPDRHHLQNLAEVLNLRGKKRTAAVVRRRAKTVADEHMTPELADAIRQAELELGKG